MTLLIAEKGWSKAQLLNSLEDFSVQDLQAFIPKVLTKGMFIESIAYGNITQKVELILYHSFDSVILYYLIKESYRVVESCREQVKINKQSREAIGKVSPEEFETI